MARVPSLSGSPMQTLLWSSQPLRLSFQRLRGSPSQLLCFLQVILRCMEHIENSEAFTFLLWLHVVMLPGRGSSPVGKEAEPSFGHSPFQRVRGWKLPVTASRVAANLASQKRSLGHNQSIWADVISPSLRLKSLRAQHGVMGSREVQYVALRNIRLIAGC